MTRAQDSRKIASSCSLLFSGALILGCASSEETTQESDSSEESGDSESGADSDDASDDASDDGGSDDGELPDDSSQAAIEAFLATESYRDWTGDSVIRVGGSVVNPHGDALRVFFNQAAVDSIRAGTESSLLGAMAVKEVHDDTGVVMGKAVRWKTGSGELTGDWTHYCTAPQDSELCTGATIELPVFGTGMSMECGTCHGGKSFFAKLPF